MSSEITVRICESLDDFHACVALQREVWGEDELEVEPADRPALEMARVPRFQETVYYIRDLIAQFEAEAGGKSK